jgi:hypothetical protein
MQGAQQEEHPPVEQQTEIPENKVIFAGTLATIVAGAGACMLVEGYYWYLNQYKDSQADFVSSKSLFGAVTEATMMTITLLTSLSILHCVLRTNYRQRNT